MARAAHQAAKAAAMQQGEVEEHGEVEEQGEVEEEGEVEEQGEVDDVGARAAGAPSAGHKRPRGRAPKGKVWNGLGLGLG